MDRSSQKLNTTSLRPKQFSSRGRGQIGHGHQKVLFFSPKSEPEVGNLKVSSITPEGFHLSWTADESGFDNFIIKIQDAQRQHEPVMLTVPGSERTRTVTGLRDGTEYEIELHGIASGQRSPPIKGEATT
ncbi:hypothetical protein AB205_0165720, partial [Aquarana catesbeiana]